MCMHCSLGFNEFRQNRVLKKWAGSCLAYNDYHIEIGSFIRFDLLIASYRVVLGIFRLTGFLHLGTGSGPA